MSKESTVSSSPSLVSTAAPESEAGQERALELGSHEVVQSSGTAPCDTLIFLDWDDTLFPTTELLDHWNLEILSEWISGDKPVPPLNGSPRRASSRRGDSDSEQEEDSEDDLSLEETAKRAWATGVQELRRSLRRWETALYRYLERCCKLSDQVCIVTNSRRPWVHVCVDRFAPKLRELLDREGGPKVIYASEELAGRRFLRAQAGDLRPVRSRAARLYDEEMIEEQTAAKLAVMRREAAAFYGRQPGRPWNVLSLGDMPYEHDAVQELTFRDCHSECCKTKAVICPSCPSFSDITVRLTVSRLALHLYVQFQGDIDLDLRNCKDPMTRISKALNHDFSDVFADEALSRLGWHGRTF